MIERVHKYRDQIEDEIVGPSRDELARIFDRAEIKLAGEAKRFNSLITSPNGALASTPAAIEKAQSILADLDDEINRYIRTPGKEWANQAAGLAHTAGRELARVNFDVDKVAPELVQAAYKNVTLTRGELLVGAEDMYKIVNTVGDDVGEWFRRETMDAVLDGVPVVNKLGGDSLMNRLIESGRLKPITIKTQGGRLIRRSVSQRAEAIARIEMGKIINKTHEKLASDILGDDAVYRNSNPRDSRTTHICRRASAQPPMTLEQWSASEFGRPPRLRPFHLCRSVLIGGEADWFEDAAPEKPPTKPTQSTPKPAATLNATAPIAEAIQQFDRGDQVIRRLTQTDKAATAKIRELTRAREGIQGEFDEAFNLHRSIDMDDVAAREKSNDRLREIYERASGLDIELTQTRAGQRDRVLGVLEKAGDNTDPLRPKLRMRGESKQRAEASRSFLSRLLNYDQEIRFEIKNGRGERFRSAAYSNRVVEMNKRAPIKVHAHEQAHIIQYTVPGVQKRLDEFLAYRVGTGEKIVQFSEKWPASKFKPDEYGYKDDFVKTFGDEASAYYAGKVGGAGNDSAREILSMGVELLYADPVGFAERDPEYFKFILGLLDGSIR